MTVNIELCSTPSTRRPNPTGHWQAVREPPPCWQLLAAALPPFDVPTSATPGSQDPPLASPGTPAHPSAVPISDTSFSPECKTCTKTSATCLALGIDPNLDLGPVCSHDRFRSERKPCLWLLLITGHSSQLSKAARLMALNDSEDCLTSSA